MRKKMFIIFLSIALMSLFTFVPNSVVAGYVTIADWDTLNVGEWYGYQKSIWFEKFDGDDFNVTDAESLSGTKSLHLRVRNWIGSEDDDDDGYINLTSPFSYCYAFQFDVRLSFDDEEAGGNYGEVRFDMYFYNSTDVEVLRLRWRDERLAHNRHLHCYDVFGATHTIWNIPNDDYYNYTVSVTHMTGNTMNYSIFDYDTGSWLGGVETSCRTTADWQNFSYIFIDTFKESEGLSSDGAFLDMYIDDLRFYLSGDTTEQYGNVSGLTSFCTGSYYYSVLTSKNIIEQRFNVNMKGYIRAVDLYLQDDVTGFAPEGTESMGWYTLAINGETVGSPSYAIPTGDNLILRWIDFSIQLDDEVPLFEFMSTIPDAHLGAGSSHWDLFLSDNFELDDVRVHDWLPQWGNGIWNGNELEYPQDKPLAMCFYYDIYQENPSYYDNVDTDKISYNEYENVVITGEISTLSPDSYLRIYHDGVQFNRQGFGGLGQLITVGSNYNFYTSFVPDNTSCEGEWNISIWRGGSAIAYSDNFTVSNLNAVQYNGLLWTTPDPSRIGGTFTIGYLYDKTFFDNYYGAILISEYSSFSDAYGSFTLLRDKISANGSFTYEIGTDGIYYFWLVVNENGSYSPIYVDPHGVGFVFLNQLNVEHSELYLEEQGGLTYATQRFTGFHSYYGSNIWLRINGVDYVDLRTQNNFDVTWDFSDDGLYFAELVKYDFTGEVVLDNVSFIILEPYVPTQQEMENESFGMLLMLLFGVFLAVMVGIFAGGIGSLVTFGGYVTLFSLEDFAYSVFPMEVAYIIVLLVAVVVLLFILK